MWDNPAAYTKPKYFFDKTIYETGFDRKGVADASVEKAWMQISRTGRRLARCRRIWVLKVVSEIYDPVTTTDELIPSARPRLSARIRLAWQSLRSPEKRSALCRARQGDSEGAEGA